MVRTVCRHLSQGQREGTGRRDGCPRCPGRARARASAVAHRLSPVGAWPAVEETAWPGFGEGELWEDRACMTPLRGEPPACHTGVHPQGPLLAWPGQPEG